MPRMREFTFDNGKEDKVIEAMSYKKAVKSYQSSANLKDDGNMVNVYWLGKKGKEEVKSTSRELLQKTLSK